MKHFIIIITFLISAVSCASLRQNVSRIEQKDTIITHIRDSVIFKDSIIYTLLPYERAYEKLEYTDTSFLEPSLAKSKAYIEQGKLHHTLENKRDSIAKIVPIPVKFHIEQKQEKQKGMIIKTIEVEKRLTKWQRLVMDLGYIFIGTILSIILFFFFKSKIWKLFRIFGV